MYFGIGVHSPFEKVEAGASQATWSIFFNGNFMVAIFILITAYIYTKKFLDMPDQHLKNNIIITVIKRYCRLCLPIFIVSVLILIIYKGGLIRTEEMHVLSQSPWINAYYNTDLSLFEAIKTSFISVPFFGNGTFSSAFWMINYIMVGTLFAMFLGMIGAVTPKYAKRIYYLIATIFLFSNTLFFVVVLGAILALQKEKHQKKQLLIGPFALLLGIFLGAYPSGVTPTNYYDIFSKISVLGIDPIIFYHSLGAYFFVLAICKLKVAQSILSQSFFVHLNKISFAVYLIHIPIIFTFSIRMFLKIFHSTNSNYMLAVGISFLSTTIVVFICSYIFHYLIERPLYKSLEKKLNKSFNIEKYE